MSQEVSSTDPPSEPPVQNGGGRATRNIFRATGLCCVAFAAIDLTRTLGGGRSLHADSFLDAAGPYLPWLLLLYGMSLFVRAKRPTTRRPILGLTLAIAVSATLVAALTIGRTPRIPDEVIVQQGSYPDLCPGVTIEEMLARGHDRVEWLSYDNKYGYRSVQAACFDEGDDPTVVLVWNIDDDRRFLIQFAMKDGASVDPYGLIGELCRGTDATTETPIGP